MFVSSKDVSGPGRRRREKNTSSSVKEQKIIKRTKNEFVKTKNYIFYR